MNQIQIILDYLIKNKRKGITSYEAFEKFGITRLSDKIFKLKQQGYIFHTRQDFNDITRTEFKRYFYFKKK